jgi:hypothetical protein
MGAGRASSQLLEAAESFCLRRSLTSTAQQIAEKLALSVHRP